MTAFQALMRQYDSLAERVGDSIYWRQLSRCATRHDVNEVLNQAFHNYHSFCDMSDTVSTHFHMYLALLNAGRILLNQGDYDEEYNSLLERLAWIQHLLDQQPLFDK